MCRDRPEGVRDDEPAHEPGQERTPKKSGQKIREQIRLLSWSDQADAGILEDLDNDRSILWGGR
jgi:hypothetical protein